MSVNPVTMVLVDLTEVPSSGQASMLLRMNGEDFETINLAAQVMGMKQAEFLRAAAVNTAKKVISENAR